jgi:hypothetical protein
MRHLPEARVYACTLRIGRKRVDQRLAIENVSA